MISKKNFVPVVCIALMVAISGAAAQGFAHIANGIQVTSSDQTFAAQEGEGPVSLATAYTPLDQPKTVRCASANGCVIVFSASVFFNESSGSSIICGYVDGNSANPKCSKPNPDHLNAADEGSAVRGSRQLAIVTQGDHSVRTKIRVLSAGGAVDHWETDYVVYSR